MKMKSPPSIAAAGGVAIVKDGEVPRLLTPTSEGSELAGVEIREPLLALADEVVVRHLIEAVLLAENDPVGELVVDDIRHGGVDHGQLDVLVRGEGDGVGRGHVDGCCLPGLGPRVAVLDDGVEEPLSDAVGGSLDANRLLLGGEAGSLGLVVGDALEPFGFALGTLLFLGLLFGGLALESALPRGGEGGGRDGGTGHDAPFKSNRGDGCELRLTEV